LFPVYANFIITSLGVLSRRQRPLGHITVSDVSFTQPTALKVVSIPFRGFVLPGAGECSRRAC
jgi:hypothetical protein